MPVSVTTGNFATDSAFFNKVKRISNLRMLPSQPQGLYAFTRTEAISTGSLDDIGDKVVFLKFPDQCRLVDLQITSDDLDTDGSPTIRLDVQVRNAAGTEVVLINSSQAAVAGTSDRLDEDGGHLLRDVSNQFLEIEVEAVSATPAAGNVTLSGIVLIGEANRAFCSFA